MATKYMSVEEMVGASAPLVTAGHPDRVALEQEPQLVGLLPALDRSHQDLLDSQQIALTPERLAEIQKAQDGLDFRHDDVLRAVWYCILAALFMTTDDEVKEQLSDLRDTLLPDGLSAINKSYREEVGQARIVESRLTIEHRSLMAGISLDQGTLLDAVEEWFELARQLGELDRERSGGLPVSADSARLSVGAARNQWIRAIRMIRDVLAMLPSNNPAIDAILERIAVTERDATRRFLARNGGSSEELTSDEASDQVVDGAPDSQGDDVPDEAGDEVPGELPGTGAASASSGRAVASAGAVSFDGNAPPDVANDEVSGEFAIADAG